MVVERDNCPFIFHFRPSSLPRASVVRNQQGRRAPEIIRFGDQ